MTDSFDQALAQAAHEEAEAQAERRREKEERRANRMVTFEELRTRIATKDSALKAFGFVRGEIVDEDRNDYRVVLSNEKKMIAAGLARFGSGYHAYVWWDHVRSDDGFVEPIDTADAQSLDELMTVLGAWVGHHGTPKD